MRVFFELNALPEFRNAVLTIGSFDGVHAGHQEILRRVIRLARQHKGESIVVTFHPHPREVVYPQDDRPLRLLTTIRERIELLEQYGIDNVVVVPFTVEFSQQSADEYIQKFLIESFRPKFIVIGYDHRFGLNRQGDINFLRWHGEQGGYEVVEIEQQIIDNNAVSSSKIRAAVERGDMPVARTLMEHFFQLSGPVVRGQNIGMELGFPTANLDIPAKNKLIPPDGIYAVFAHHNGIRYGGMLYIGSRPTLKTHHNRTIEVHVFDFKQSIYGQEVQLELVERIRDDQAFQDLDALRQQLQKDQEAAQAVLARHGWSKDSVQTQRKHPEAAIVILNYNGRSHLERFLPSVLASGYPNMRVVAADNGSPDDSIAFLEKRYPEVEHLDLGRNFGFAEGYNQALKTIPSPYLVLLNSDVEVTPGWLDPIIELMEHDRSIAAVQPKILSLNDKSRFEYAGACGGWLDALGYPFCRGRIFAETELDEGQYDTVEDIFWASGAAFVIRKSLYEQLGGFDGSFFAHSEEIDLCWRLKKAGYRIVVQPRSVVYHLGGGTLAYNTPRKTYLNFRNSLYTILKNERAARLWWLFPLRLVLDGLAGLLFLSQGKWRHILSIIQAHFAVYIRWGRLMHRRAQAQKRIEANRINVPADKTGRYRGSIVWQYYARNVHQFSKLKR
ncbi:MAG: bifunctional riboflavin kinase/FAD synthetase [Saprospiraceae bacterium]|jgi:hypothetical protein|nr:bifunctional riboflavin kinase/FAD synthetase [Saprospiraceae bacterium]HRD79169.1 bifunctional riboflavin kinase/FAD synthetase [Saprospiraceae bacterium]HRK80637.1 bifunctional riboflavin kinase/FAD synthetase [Saprospiraceae bacterium]